VCERERERKRETAMERERWSERARGRERDRERELDLLADIVDNDAVNLLHLPPSLVTDCWFHVSYFVFRVSCFVF
jgi:hypothetical protein